MIVMAFGYISAALSILMVLPYIRDILMLKTKPERASWFIWTVLGLIAFFSQFAKGATGSLWLTAGQTLAVFIVLLFAIRYGVGGFAKRDKLALAAAGFGLILWYLTKEAYTALLMVIAIDAIGSMLTLLKAYEHPETETLSTWVMSGTSGVFGALAVGGIHWILLSYPLYIILANYSITAAILFGRKRKRLASASIDTQ